MVPTPARPVLLALAALSLGAGLSACGDDKASTPPAPVQTAAPAPVADISGAVSASTSRAKVRLVVDIIGASDKPVGVVVSPREDFGISSALKGSPAESDKAELKGIDLLQRNPPKGSFTVPFKSTTKFVDSVSGKRTRVKRAAFLASLKAGPRLVVLSWAGKAAKSKDAQDILAQAPIEVRVVSDKTS